MGMSKCFAIGINQFNFVINVLDVVKLFVCSMIHKVIPSIICYIQYFYNIVNDLSILTKRLDMLMIYKFLKIFKSRHKKLLYVSFICICNDKLGEMSSTPIFANDVY
jgi:hypothetical protein